MLDKLFPINVMMEGDAGDGNGGDHSGSGSDPWFNSLPEGVRDWDEVKNSETPDKFWDQVTNMRAFLGQSIRIPGENANKEEQTKFHEKLLSKVPGLIYRPGDDEESQTTFYNAMGRPEKDDGYAVPEIDGKGKDLDMTPAKGFMKTAHKHGLTQKQFEGIVSDMTMHNIEAASQDMAAMEEGKTQLKNEWGAAYEQNIGRISTLVKNTGAPMQLLDSINAGHIDPATGKWLLSLADGFKGEGSNLIDDKSNDNKLSPKQARQEITDIMNNKEHPYWNKTMAGHEDAKKHLRSLYKMADPSGAVAGSHTAGAGGEVTFG